jgi:RimJ/RimL family protein N-acetyltransferase
MNDFNLRPTLAGKLLGLRPLLSTDFENLFGVSSDPLIWEIHPEKYRYQRNVFENFFKVALESKGALLAFDLQSQEVIGSSRYSSLDEEDRSIEIGYTFLARKCWCRGYNSEMKELMLSHAFQHVDLVNFYIGEQNIRSQRAIEKLGAILSEKSERQPLEGAKYISLRYCIEKSEWIKRELPF